MAGLLFAIGFLILLALLGPVQSIADRRPTDDPVTPTPTPTTVPFLSPPFARPYRITSYLDHWVPDYTWDDTIVIFNGDQASAIDGILDRTPTFRGGYWFPDTHWYIYYDGHNAIDYGTGAGATILAAAPGEVVFAGSAPSSCDTPLQYVCIRHAGDYRTFYLHLEGICVNQGQWVEAGDPLGISGNSGCSLGPHLHFAVEHNHKYTDPYGWRPTDVEDPLIEYSGEQATWLWLPDQPPSPVGKLTHPPPTTRTNGDLFMLFVPDTDSPPVTRVEFLVYYRGSWQPLGADENDSDGWSLTWDTRNVPEGVVWLHAWATGPDGRVSKGSPIRTDITVDRHPPQGFIVGLEPGSVAGGRLWLYAASYDPASTTQQVTFLIRESGTDTVRPGEWREIGDAQWLHTSNWLTIWEPAASGIAQGTRLDIVARLTDGAGNAILTQPVEGIIIDRRIPGGELLSPRSDTPFTTTLDLVFVPFDGEGTAPISRVAFYVWHDGSWHEAGVDRDGSDGWFVPWSPTHVGDQSRMRVQARVVDVEGQVNTALPQVTALTLDRTPPRAGYIRPATGGVARPDVDYRVWASDGGSGVDYVEFFVNTGPGWLKIGQDRSAQDGWTAQWDAEGVSDGLVDYSARVYDRAGNVSWTVDVRDVALDRAPPSGHFAFPVAGMRIGNTITLTLDVTDTVSGLDRAIFYARYDDRWHHLGADDDHEDGFSVAWDTTAAGEGDEVILTAWVYDRAGNHGELPHVGGLVLGHSVPFTKPLVLAVSPTLTPTVPPPTMSPTTAPSTPTASPVPSATPTEAVPTSPPPAATPTATATSTEQPTPVPSATPTPTPTPTPTAPLPPTPVPSPTLSPISPAHTPLVPAAYWYLIGSGMLVALVLLLRSLRIPRAGR